MEGQHVGGIRNGKWPAVWEGDPKAKKVSKSLQGIFLVDVPGCQGDGEREKWDDSGVSVELWVVTYD